MAVSLPTYRLGPTMLMRINEGAVRGVLESDTQSIVLIGCHGSNGRAKFLEVSNVLWYWYRNGGRCQRSTVFDV